MKGAQASSVKPKQAGLEIASMTRGATPLPAMGATP